MAKKLALLILLVNFLFIVISCGENLMEKEFREFVADHLKKVQPLMKEMNQAYWDAAVTGDKEKYEHYADCQYQLKTIYANPIDFLLIKKFQSSGQITAALLKRQLDVLYKTYLGNQIDSTLLKQIVERSSIVENKFSIFRGTIGDKKVTTNEINTILKNETNSEKRRQAWLASQQVGIEVANDIIELVKLRNQAAKKLGFDNYYLMSLKLTDQSIADLTKIFNDLAALTDEPFGKLKTELDSILADEYGITAEEMMPWHYHDPFFQEGPQVFKVDLDTYYANQNIKELAATFYQGIDLPANDILERSDLYEKEGKNPHAFCTNIDRAGDVRILCNLQNDERWMETLQHELGHAVYDKYVEAKLPFLLREPAHSFTTEAIAMLFGRLSRNAYWLQSMIGLSDTEREKIFSVAQKSLRLKQLVFARWCQVMFRFEQELYKNPDQDLNALWWDLKEKYQKIKKPPQRQKPDWAAKIHFTIAPVYYHNYMLGELFASQLHCYLAKNVVRSDSPTSMAYANNKAIGSYLKNKVFKVGNKYYWNEMIKQATGEYLTANYFVHQFIAE